MGSNHGPKNTTKPSSCRDINEIITVEPPLGVVVVVVSQAVCRAPRHSPSSFKFK